MVRANISLLQWEVTDNQGQNNPYDNGLELEKKVQTDINLIQPQMATNSKTYKYVYIHRLIYPSSNSAATL